ncbi:hypothetical protein C8Q78DRAFT_699086 [Trametes maxima]|nr:hypothetical protein C8Q78DRAFT_699086 [Trametes maxima]
MASAMPFPPATAASILMNNYLAAASMALLYYDYCLTLSAEVDRFWRSGKPSPTSIVFVLNRYLGLFGPIPAMFEFFGHFTPELSPVTVISPIRCCGHSNHYWKAPVILIIRTYALYNRSKRILLVLIVLAIIAMAVTLLVHFVGTAPVTDDVPQHPVQSPSLCDLSLTAKEGLLIILTLRQTLRMQEGLRIHHSMLRVLFRDGVIYYSILFVVSVANILTFIVPGMNGNSRGIATTFANAMSSTLASRILLHLRDPRLHRGVRQIGQQPLSPRSYIDTGYSTAEADTSFETSAPTVLKPPYRGGACLSEA